MENKKYKVKFLKDQEYAVIEDQGDEYDTYNDTWVSIFTGSIADCEAYIRLQEKGYLE